MKKLILPSLIIYLCLLVFPINIHAQSSDCWQEWNDESSACAQSIEKCNACISPNPNPGCTLECNKSTDKCDQTVNTLHACLGVDKEPMKLQPEKPGHLTCEEWKRLMIAGTAKNCFFPTWTDKELKCLSSVAELAQAFNHPADYLLDFDPGSCKVEQDDLRRFKAGLPITSGSSAEISQKTGIVQKSQITNPISKFARDVGNYFKLSGINAGKDIKPDFSVDKPPFKDPKTQEQEARVVNPIQPINDWIKDTFGEAAPVVNTSDPGILNRKPLVSDNVVSQVKQRFDPQKSPYQVPILEGDILVRLPGSGDWIPVKAGDKVVPGSTIFTAMDSNALLMIENKGVVQLLPFTEITISDQGLERADKEGKASVDLRLRTGEIEINVEGGVYTGGFQVQLTNGVAGVRGTHFWVARDSKRDISYVGVYKGTVDVKNNAGSGQVISPTGDKSEAVTIAGKLSIIKLTLAGLVIAVIVSGFVWILKRRRKKSFRSKK